MRSGPRERRSDGRDVGSRGYGPLGCLRSSCTVVFGRKAAQRALDAKRPSRTISLIYIANYYDRHTKLVISPKTSRLRLQITDVFQVVSKRHNPSQQRGSASAESHDGAASFSSSTARRRRWDLGPRHESRRCRRTREYGPRRAVARGTRSRTRPCGPRRLVCLERGQRLDMAG